MGRAMSGGAPAAPREQAAFGWLVPASFVLALIAAVAFAVGDPYIAELMPNRFWQSLRLIKSPVKVSLFIVPGLVLLSLALHWARKAGDVHGLLIVLLTVGMQTNGLHPGGLDMITFVPIVALGVLLAEHLMNPRRPLHLNSVILFGLLLLVLDLPHMMNTNTYGPGRFIINLISGIRGMMAGFVLILLIDDRRHLRLAIKAMIVVAVISAAIGVGQIVLNKFTGISLSLAPELRDTKPTFLGTMLRASGLTTWSQWLADFGLLAVPFLLFAVVRARRFRRALVAWTALALVLAGVFFTFTYAAYVGIALICLMFPFVAWPRRTLHFLLGAALVTTVFYMAGGLEWVRDRGSVQFAASSGMVERKSYLLAAAEKVVRDPWMGSGLYADEEFSGNFYRKRAHNTGMQAWAYFGLPGLLVFLALMLTNYTQLWLLALSNRGETKRMFQSFAMVLSGVMLTMFAQPNLTAPVTWYLLGLSSAAIRLHAGARTMTEAPT